MKLTEKILATFRLFRRAEAALPVASYISITNTGSLYLSKSAAELLDGQRHVELHYSRDMQMVGLNPCQEGGDNAYVLGKGCYISARLFLKWFELAGAKGKRYAPSKDETSGMVVFRLDKPIGPIRHTERRK